MNRTYPAASTAQVSPLSDADAASVSALAARRRARMSVADANAAYRAELITEYVRVRGDWAAELRLLADATAYDMANPDDTVSLFDELHAIELFGESAGVAA